ncbi:putative 2-succinyl-6-hydroxy-2,4-cyclohexadiene-1-carboxylate synthase [Shewanella sairae]|uniref:Putative 2-succinyl-6-hydroxy-2,4-cyclohexadiene-1-carboxylate synthase n=1 Tax=Shewanella sairae TaxID=190310 RepID=A0ABQ4NYT3_9GAMM|nr:2-succinyl-6-hydroxy-2,4-cyclohexadiene-1-carboxylate synthase [Shewanella sairae]MCL1131696.1 2-succinyl-6-hydroxy-2,4-cyclohexadiene-1-carboxylate synthase [Shewanella sairae]GIU40138.1 putative 2-succinyl-6-hydroxy-2,4-cyclohexadiene-1-carboxylate synthase [Shewanella sairae]
MLSYRCSGNIDAPAVVFLHGFLGSKGDWNEIISQLQDDFYCICIDLPGHGDNKTLNCDELQLPTPGFNRCVELIVTTLSLLDIQHYHLVGYSLGGRIALHIAKLYPEQLLSLVLESCHPGLQSEADKIARKQNDAAWANKLCTLAIADFLTLWYQQAVFSDLTTAEQRSLVLKRSHNNPLALANCYQATSLAEQDELWNIPSRLTVTSHFIAGHQDSKFMALASRWQQQQPLALHCINASGHNVHLAAPEAFSNKLRTLFS